MCVIAVCEEKRISDEQVAKMWEANDAGAGIAWREDGQVRWEKGLSLEEVTDLVAKVPLPFVVHFRIPSCGGKSKELTHPFPIEKDTDLALSGKTKGMVLFHNGHYRDWKETALKLATTGKGKLPLGVWSDTRVMAWAAAVMGLGVLTFFDEKVIAFGPDTLEAFGSGWDKMDGFWVSNKSWEYRTVHRRIGGGGYHQTPPASLPAPKSGTEGTTTASDNVAKGSPGVGPAEATFPAGSSKATGGEGDKGRAEGSSEGNGKGTLSAIETGKEGSQGTAVIGDLIAGDEATRLFQWVRSLNPRRHKGVTH